MENEVRRRSYMNYKLKPCSGALGVIESPDRRRLEPLFRVGHREQLRAAEREKLTLRQLRCYFVCAVYCAYVESSR